MRKNAAKANATSNTAKTNITSNAAKTNTTSNTAKTNTTSNTTLGTSSNKSEEWVKLPPDPKIYPLIRSEVESQLYLDYSKQQSAAGSPKIDEWVAGQIKEELYTNWYKKKFGVIPPSIYGPPKQ